VTSEEHLAQFGPNPVIKAMDEGHYSREETVKLPKRLGQPEQTIHQELCRADQEEWPCARIKAARVAAASRGDRMAALKNQPQLGVAQGILPKGTS
jgi:hypothetical protein